MTKITCPQCKTLYVLVKGGEVLKCSCGYKFEEKNEIPKTYAEIKEEVFAEKYKEVKKTLKKSLNQKT